MAMTRPEYRAKHKPFRRPFCLDSKMNDRSASPLDPNSKRTAERIRRKEIDPPALDSASLDSAPVDLAA